mgnify:CR=1 FL=1
MKLIFESYQKNEDPIAHKTVERLLEFFGKSIANIINVIDPIIEAISKDNTIKKVGLIATKTTVESGVYQEKLNRRNPEIEIDRPNDSCNNVNPPSLDVNTIVRELDLRTGAQGFASACH